MPTTFTISTDDPSVIEQILTVMRGGVVVTNAPSAILKTSKANSASARPPTPPSEAPAPLPTPTMAAPAPTQAEQTGRAPAPSSGASNGGTTVSQAAEACNAQMDIFLKAHKAAEAKMILQKYGARRISDVTDVGVLHSIYREFGGQ